jgi:hypothetical protein
MQPDAPPGLSQTWLYRSTGISCKKSIATERFSHAMPVVVSSAMTFNHAAGLSLPPRAAGSSLAAEVPAGLMLGVRVQISAGREKRVVKLDVEMLRLQIHQDVHRRHGAG